MTRERQTLGELGENLACDELTRRGYAIVARRYRWRGGEVDIIAVDGETVVFIEVKTRTGAGFGSGAEAVTWSKQRHIVATASMFLTRERLLDRPVRFDVVSVDTRHEPPRIEVFRSAFDASC